jgi:nitrous oxidase accessory protein
MNRFNRAVSHSAQGVRPSAPRLLPSCANCHFERTREISSARANRDFSLRVRSIRNDIWRSIDLATARPAALLALGIFLTLLLLGTRSAAAAARLVVSPHGPYTTIQDALRDAHAGDVIQVQGGTYRGNVVVDKSIILEGVERPVLDAENHGTVVTINAPDVTVRGFEIRNSGSEPDQDHAGITANAPRATIENNTLRQVLFGIFIAQAADSLVRGNDVTSKDEYDSGRKGDAIRLWYSPRVIVADNHVHHARDVVVWYSQGVQIQNNLIEHGRYGVHLMYCDDARMENNRVRNNSVGLYAMYSQNIVMRGNDVRGQRGPSGYALGFKDTGNVRVQDNLLVDNRGGLFMDGTPFSPNDYARFERNVFAFNDVAVTMMPAVRGADFSDNVFWENSEQMAVNGGGAKAEANRWRNNYWSDYAGLDANGDGLGDLPYVAEKFFENMTDREPMLRALMYSPAAQTLEFAATLFPLVKPLPKLRDAAPRLGAPPFPAHVDTARGNALETFLLSTGLLGAALAIGALTRQRGETRMLKPNQNVPQNATKQIDAFANAVAVRAVAVGKAFGKTRVLERVNFQVRAGQILAVWGPNGAGKTTLIKALLGLIPFEGELVVANIFVKQNAKRVRRFIGYVPQEVMFYDWTVQATMEFYARLKRADTTRVAILLEQLGLGAHARKNVTALSGGLKQRLALALALLADPPILLLDEPTANLDTQARAEYLKLVAALKQQGKTILFASHRLEEVEALADDVVWLGEQGAARSMSLEEWRAEIAPTVQLTLWFGNGQRERANEFLIRHGWDAHMNGRGTVVVRTRAEQKLRALQELQAQGFHVDDFDIERAL